MSKKWMSILIACLLLLTASPLAVHTLAVDTEPDQEAKELIQQGLTIYEIDREVERLNEQDAKIVAQIHNNQIDVERQGTKVQDTRKHAGKVLRAYYTGERDSIWLLLFSVKSFADVLKTFEYLNMIVQNDHRALANFTDSYEQLKKLQLELEESRIQLQQTKENYLKQRERLVVLQEELDKQLALSSQAKEVEQQIKSLNEEWEQKGLPIFREYFQQLSVAFMALPELVLKNNGNNIKADGFTMTDQDLNDFLISKNELFHTLAFSFTKNNVTAKGNKDGQAMNIEGNFIVIEGKEMNEVRYQVNKLDFNGYQLPDTTIASLIEEYKLGFFPRAATKGLIEVTGISNEEGKLIIKFKISF
jgi:peptidoglycan hydrolase CwlO-like protein